LSKTEAETIAIGDFKFPHSVIVAFQIASETYFILCVFRMQRVNIVDENVVIPWVFSGIKLCGGAIVNWIPTWQRVTGP